MSHCNKVIGSSPEGEQKAHKCTCFARSALFTGSFDLHALKGNDDNDDDDNDDNDDDDDKDDDDKDHDNENAIFEYVNNPGQGTQLPVLTASFWRSRRLR